MDRFQAFSVMGSKIEVDSHANLLERYGEIGKISQ
jgi:hypothetical protein